jgi:hypothetical protein
MADLRDPNKLSHQIAVLSSGAEGDATPQSAYAEDLRDTTVER